MEKNEMDYKWKESIETRKNEIINRINSKSVYRIRNSFLEPFELKDYVNPSVGIPYGLSKIEGSGRCVLGERK